MRKLLAVLALAMPVLAGPHSFKPSVTVSVGTSATACALSTRHTFVEVYNTDTVKYVEVSFDSTLTYGKGRPVPPGQFIQFTELAQGQLLYCVTSSGTVDARVQEGFAQ